MHCLPSAPRAPAPPRGRGRKLGSIAPKGFFYRSWISCLLPQATPGSWLAIERPGAGLRSDPPIRWVPNRPKGAPLELWIRQRLGPPCCVPRCSQTGRASETRASTQVKVPWPDDHPRGERLVIGRTTAAGLRGGGGGKSRNGNVFSGT